MDYTLISKHDKTWTKILTEKYKKLKSKKWIRSGVEVFCKDGGVIVWCPLQKECIKEKFDLTEAELNLLIETREEQKKSFYSMCRKKIPLEWFYAVSNGKKARMTEELFEFEHIASDFTEVLWVANTYVEYKETLIEKGPEILKTGEGTWGPSITGFFVLYPPKIFKPCSNYTVSKMMNGKINTKEMLDAKEITNPDETFRAQFSVRYEDSEMLKFIQGMAGGLTSNAGMAILMGKVYNIMAKGTLGFRDHHYSKIREGIICHRSHVTRDEEIEYFEGKMKGQNFGLDSISGGFRWLADHDYILGKTGKVPEHPTTDFKVHYSLFPAIHTHRFYVENITDDIQLLFQPPESDPKDSSRIEPLYDETEQILLNPDIENIYESD